MASSKADTSTFGLGSVPWFTWGIVIALFLAWLWPSVGATSGPLHPEVLIPAGVVSVFFLHGVRLPLQALRRGVAAWRAHIVCQLLGFGVFPLMGFAVLRGTGHVLPESLGVGIFFLCALPGTLASAAVLTGVAGGSMAVALFDSALSSVLGVVLTPSWIGLVAPAAAATGDLADAIGPLLGLLVLPVALGQLCRALVGRLKRRPIEPSRAARFGAVVRAVDPVVVLYIAYSVFCDAFSAEVFAGVGWADLATVALVCAVLLFLGLVVGECLGRLARIPREERIAVVFCGASKSLAVGVPMATVIFGERTELALLLLPLMFYHPIQLVLLGLLASRLRPAGTS
jgi:solute carrier family 10 (sodium/bile acid cotransporter), member 7